MPNQLHLESGVSLKPAVCEHINRNSGFHFAITALLCIAAKITGDSPLYQVRDTSPLSASASQSHLTTMADDTHGFMYSVWAEENKQDNEKLLLSLLTVKVTFNHTHTPTHTGAALTNTPHLQQVLGERGCNWTGVRILLKNTWNLTKIWTKLTEVREVIKGLKKYTDNSYKRNIIT